MAGSKYRFWVCKSTKIVVFRPSNLLGARMNTPIWDRLFQDIPCVMWQSFAKIGSRTSKNRWTEKKKKITRPKHKSPAIAGDCNKYLRYASGHRHTDVLLIAIFWTPPGAKQKLREMIYRDTRNSELQNLQLGWNTNWAASIAVFLPRDAMLARVLGVAILSVRPSVRLSVWHTRVLWLIQRTYWRYLYTTWKGNPSSFLPPNSGWWATSPST